MFKGHAFVGLDEQFNMLQTLLLQMQERNLLLLDMLEQELTQVEKRYAQAKAFDKEINALEHQVDHVASSILSKFTVLGTELRFILSVFKMAYILECIADNLKNCIKRLSKLKSTVPPELGQAIRAIAQGTQAPLKECLSLMEHFDEVRFQQLVDQKKDVSQLYRQALLVLQQLPASSFSSDDVTELHFIIRNVERISDLISDSAKLGYFIHTGEKYEKPV